jgi:nucleoid DNA-binding protein
MTTDETPPVGESDAAPEAGAPKGDEIKKPTLIDLVVAQSGVKKKDAKPVVEAVLAVLGQALSDGKELNLQPLGKVKITRTKDTPNGQVLTARVRRSTQSIAGTEGLETSDEDS